ncbi:pyruvate formate lyase activating enzyme [Lachnospiraceae bacterium]|nr:pyruvate formate lyase activating enzyme [Lachnospiraceae bacterium]
MNTDSVICPYCPHHCRLSEGSLGFCRARTAENGRSVPLNYGKVTSIALDPIEKKPLAHFFPGSRILSVGSYGCNLRCPFCQNHEISQSSGDLMRELYDLTPERLLRISRDEKPEGNIGVAFTYNEPLTSWEYVRDASELLHEDGQKTVLVSNGCFTDDVIDEVLPVLDAMNIDLKAFHEGFYKNCDGDLETVKHFIKRAEGSCHIELTTLIIPHENDSHEEMDALSSWIASLNPEIPLHITRFFPMFQMTDRGPTDIGRMRELYDIASSHLKYVHLGNV